MSSNRTNANRTNANRENSNITNGNRKNGNRKNEYRKYAKIKILIGQIPMHETNANRAISIEQMHLKNKVNAYRTFFNREWRKSQ